MTRYAMTFSIMAGEGQPLFHDFLGMSPSEPKHTEGLAPHISSSTPLHNSRGIEKDFNRVSSNKASKWPEVPCSSPPRLAGPASMSAPSFSDPSSERLSWGKGVGLLAPCDKSVSHRPDVDSRPLGKRRDSSSSNRNDSLQDRLQISVDTLENSCAKISHMELKNEKRGRLFDFPTDLDDLHLPMQPPRQISNCSQPPRQTSNCSTLLQSSLPKPEFMALNKMEPSVSPNMAAYDHSHLYQYGGFPNRNCSNASVDNTSMPLSLSRPAADEGSRTRLQISGLSNLINNVPSLTAERGTGVLGVSVDGKRVVSQSAAADSSIQKSHQLTASISHQLTVFYGGQAHVFDDVPPVKADAIMALAGSNGRSWSTTYSPWCKPSECDGLVPGLERQKNEEELRSVRRGL